jgi:predicted transcriptional regulator
MTKLLDEAIAKLKALPEQDQDRIADLLLELAAADGADHELTPEQIREVEIAMEQAARGEFASDEEMAEIWRRFDL